MSYTNPIKKGECFLIWKSGKPAVFVVTGYSKETEARNESIRGVVGETSSDEVIYRPRIIHKLSIETHPEYYL
jgi:hypothetical protein